MPLRIPDNEQGCISQIAVVKMPLEKTELTMLGHLEPFFGNFSDFT